MTLLERLTILAVLVPLACSSAARPGLEIDNSVVVDDEGKFRIKVSNTQSRDTQISKVSASCPCAELPSTPLVIPGSSVETITGVIDQQIAPPALVIRIMADGTMYSVRVVASADTPEWDRGVVYRVDVLPGSELSSVAIVTVRGTREDALAQLSTSQYDAPGIQGYSWSALRESHKRSGIWRASLSVVVSRDAGPEPIDGWFEVGGVRIRIVCVFR